MEVTETPRVAETTSLTERALSNVDTMLKNEGISYFVIGSIARYAYLGKPISEKREIDIIIPDQTKVESARQAFTFVEERNPGIKIDNSHTSDIQLRGGEYFLVHGNLVRKLPKEVMQGRTVESGNVAFQTFSPETLLHTYILAGSAFREKDWKNSLEFARWMRKNSPYDRKEYKVFHEFSRELWRNPTLKFVQETWRGFIRALPEPIRKGFVAQVYGLQPVIAARKMFNQLEETFCGGSTPTVPQEKPAARQIPARI